jgi:hypothetical protein
MEKTMIEVNLLTNFCNAYSLNTKDESAHILRIHGMNLSVF